MAENPLKSVKLQSLKVICWKLTKIYQRLINQGMVIARQPFCWNGYPSLRFPNMVKVNIQEHWTWVTRFNPLWISGYLLNSSSKSRNLNLLPTIQTSVKFRDLVSNIFSLFRRIIIKNLVSYRYLILTQYPHRNSPNRYPYISFKN